MQISARELSQILDGTIEGNPEITVSGPSKIEEGGEGTVSFLAHPKYEPFAYTTNASILLVSRDFKPADVISATLIRVDNVYECVALLLNKFGEHSPIQIGISEKANIHASVVLGEEVAVGLFSVIEEGAVVGDGAKIYPQVYIGKNAQIGKNVILHPGVKVYHDCKIGDNCIIHANTVIGSDGFGFVPDVNGQFNKIPQIGKVILEDNVEIGSNTVIDRATMGETIIKAGAKLDNLIQIAHNVEVGENTVIAAQAGIAGSTKIGKNCRLGGQSGFVGHIKVADGSRVQAQSGVAATIKETGKSVYGSPALAYNDYLKSYAVFKQLPALFKKIHQLEKKIKDLEA